MFSARKLFLVLILVAAGCATADKHVGNLSEFVYREIDRYGVDLADDEGVSAVSGTWTFKQDRFGFIIDVERGDFAQIAAMMTQMLGPPKVAVERNFDGQPQRLFVSVDPPVQIQCLQAKDAVQIVLIGKK